MKTQFMDPRFGATEVKVTFARYNNGRPAIRLSTVDTGEPWATASVNLVDTEMAPGCTAIKDVSEGRGIAQLLVDNGILEPDIVDVIPAGFVVYPVYRLSEAVMASAYPETQMLNKLHVLAERIGGRLEPRYSGRFMYGATCVGVICTDVSQCVEEAAKLGISVDQVESMGNEFIAYWPQLGCM